MTHNKKLGLKLGSKPEKFGAILLDKYVAEPAAVPDSFLVPHADSYDWGMLGNDVIGDCVPVSVFHGDETFNLWRGRDPYPWQTAQAVKLYSTLTGYNPNDPNTDQGTDPSQAMDWWVKHGAAGFTDTSKPGVHALAGFGYLPAGSPNIRRAIWEFGAVIYAIALPVGAQNQGVNWRGSNEGDPGSWGGHAVTGIGYTSDLLKLVTWAEVGDMNNAFANAYLEQVFVPLSKEVLNSAGVGPAGFNFSQMLSDLPNPQNA